MTERIKIFIVEYDCVNLITLMLWLDQFPEFDVLGTTVHTGSLASEIEAMKPDVVLLDIATPGPEDIAPMREVKSVSDPPAVLLLYDGYPAGLEGPLLDESEGQLGPESTMDDLCEAIHEAVQRKRMIVPAELAPVARAG